MLHDARIASHTPQLREFQVVGDLKSSHFSIVGVVGSGVVVGNLTSLETGGTPFATGWTSGCDPVPLTQEPSIAHAVDRFGTVVGHLPVTGEAFLSDLSRSITVLGCPGQFECDAYCSHGQGLAGGSVKSETGIEAAVWRDGRCETIGQFASVTCLGGKASAGRTRSGPAFRRTPAGDETLDLAGQHYPVTLDGDGTVALTIRTGNLSTIALWHANGDFETVPGIGGGRDVLVGMSNLGGLLAYGPTGEGKLAHAWLDQDGMTVLTGVTADGLTIECVTAVSPDGLLAGIANEGRRRFVVLFRL